MLGVETVDEALRASPPDLLTVWSYGAGVDSTAALIIAVATGLPAPFAILFSDTGGEKPKTYEYIPMFSAWLVAHGYPPITILFPNNRKGDRITLEGESLRKNSLPSLAFGFRTCSQRFKYDPQNKWYNAQPEIRAEWKAGRKICRVISYNASEWHRISFYDDPKFVNWYALAALSIIREQGRKIIIAAGLPVPPKSACFFCPATTKAEILALASDHPDLAARAVKMEDQAVLKSIKGLGRRFNWRAFLQGENVADLPPELSEAPCGCLDG